MTPPDLFSPKLASHVRRQIDRVTGGAMLLHPKGALELSETADAIVQLCDGTRTAHEIALTLAAKYEVTADVLRNHVDACLAELTHRRLLA